MAKKTSALRIQEGKSYHLNHPHNSNRGKQKVYIDYIIDSKCYGTDDGSPEKMIIYRFWLKHKKRWAIHIEHYYTLAIYNDWKDDKK